jgi:hypothetical protein
MTRAIMLVAVGASLGLGACQSKPPESAGGESMASAAATQLPPMVEHAVAVGKALEANPTATDSILAAHNLTRAGLDSLMYAIAADSAMARMYSEAMK